jgi:hypothetical protein
MKKGKRRLVIAMICYGVLILVALYVLLPVRSSNDSFILVVLLLFFALLIVKTIRFKDEDM